RRRSYRIVGHEYPHPARGDVDSIARFQAELHEAFAGELRVEQLVGLDGPKLDLDSGARGVDVKDARRNARLPVLFAGNHQLVGPDVDGDVARFLVRVVGDRQLQAGHHRLAAFYAAMKDV